MARIHAELERIMHYPNGKNTRLENMNIYIAFIHGDMT